LTYKEKFQELLEEYKNMEKAILEAQANKKTAEQQKKVLEGKIKVLLKLKVFSAEDVEKILQKLDKEIETRLNVLAEKIQEYEEELGEFKTGDVKASSDDMSNVLEEL
jgi:ABC-type methionine transport system ATPase subunit